MLDILKIKEITDKAKELNKEVSMQDVGFCCLLHSISDLGVAYRIIFGKVENKEVISEYNESDSIVWLKSEINSVLNILQVYDTDSRDISFEENKGGQIQLLDKLDSYVVEGSISAKDAIALENSIRSNLVSKFSTSKKADEQYIIVNEKFNDFCPKCGIEISVRTKESAKAKWNLIEKQQ